LDDRGRLLGAYREMSARLGSRVLVCEQVQAGVELALGMVTDPQFGPIVLVSAGGTMIELIRDRVALLPPVDPLRAGRALDRLAVRPLLDGHRGAAPPSLDALAEAIARFSELAADAAGVLSSIDVNPVIALPDRAVAVDALMVGA
jgi:hypothetical protein